MPLLLAGDLNADPGIIPCLAKGIAVGPFVDLALAHSIGAGKEPEVTCRFKLDDCAGSRRDFMVACPNALAASSTCQVTDRWFTPHFSIVADFRIRQWPAEVSCWVDTPDRSASSSSSPLELPRLLGTSTLSVVSPDLYLALRDAYDKGSVDDFWNIWSADAESGLFRHIAGLVARLILVFMPLMVEVGYGFVRDGGRAVGGIGASRLYEVSQGDEVDMASAQLFSFFNAPLPHAGHVGC